MTGARWPPGLCGQEEVARLHASAQASERKVVLLQEHPVVASGPSWGARADLRLHLLDLGGRMVAGCVDGRAAHFNACDLVYLEDVKGYEITEGIAHRLIDM